MLGSLILWLFWPSFTSALVAPGESYHTVLNTIFALWLNVTYVFTKFIRGKIEIEDIANAAFWRCLHRFLLCRCKPGFAMVIGICAGALSTIGFMALLP